MITSSSPFILIVDDNATNLTVLSQALKSAGYKVRMALDGEDALAQVRRALPELILLDIQMPKMDGFETCRQLQANPATAGIPVIFMTALADTENKVKGLSLGAVDYIAKPFEQAEVLARVQIHWRLKQLTDRLEQTVAERTQALQQAQLHVVQQEKLSALGQLVAGVAHEINNPIGCITGNIGAMRLYFEDLMRVIELCETKCVHLDPEVAAAIVDLDLDYLREDLPKLIRAMQDGGERIKAISHSLRVFSRSDSDKKQAFNIHEGLDSTLLILRHRLKANPDRSAINVITNYATDAAIECFPGQLNQVFMNILANAIDMFDEMAQTQANIMPQITIRTALIEDRVQIQIRDNGKGMTEAIQSQIFDNLFTTKSVGQGTGLGLAIAKQIIIEKHTGTIAVQSELGQGTEFLIMLPLV